MTRPGVVTLLMSDVRSDAESNDAFGLDVQFTASALRPCSAAHVLVPTTATPPSALKPYGGVASGNRTTSVTPATLRAAPSSTDATALPSTGGRAIVANTMPSRSTSAP